MATTVTRIQDRLADILRRSEDEARSLHDRTVELESDSRDMTRELQGVWALNSELQEAAEKYNHPETDRAVDARDAALKKLHRARKVIYDLLQERRVNNILYMLLRTWPICVHTDRSRPRVWWTFSTRASCIFRQRAEWHHSRR